MSLDKNLKIVIHFLSRWPRTVSTSEIVKEIQEVVKDLRDDPYRTYLFIQFVKNYINLASYPGKYQNKNFVEVLSKSLLEKFIHDEEEREAFYKKYIQDNPLNKNFHQLGAQFVEHRWIYLSVESDALRELNKELDEIITKHPLVRLLEESNKKSTRAMKVQQPTAQIAVKPTLINFLLLIPAIFSQLPTSRAQEFSKNESTAITTGVNLDLMNSVTKWEHCPNNFTLNEELEKYSKYVTVDFDSAYPFHRIVRLGLAGIAEEFLKLKKFDIEVRDNEQRTPLHIASAAGNLEMVKFFWLRGANVNAEDKEGWLPLHWATSHGYEDVVKELLSHDPIIKGAGEESIRPFAIAINHEYYEIAQLFLDHMKIGVKINTASYKKLKKSEKLVKDRHFAEALVIFNDFLKIEPPVTNFEEHIFWASVVHRRSHLNLVLNNVKEALEDLEYIIKLYPQRSVSAHYLYVDLLVQQNKFELALNAVSKGLSYFPDHILLLQLQAEIYQKIGDSFFRLKDKNYLENYKKALENYQKALQLDPENQLYKELVIVATYLSDPKNTLEYYRLHHAEFSVESILKTKTELPSQDSPAKQQRVPRKNNKLVQCSEKFMGDSNINKFQDLFEQAKSLNLNNRGAEAIRKLEAALEVAKEFVKDPCFNLYTSGVYSEFMRAYNLINDCEKALEAHHLSLYFTPVLPPQEKNTAFEAYTDILRASIKNDLKFNQSERPENIDLLEKFFFAAAIDNTSTLQVLKRKVNINQQNAKGATPLLIAVRHNRLKALEELVAAGADVNIKNLQGQTAVHLAAIEGNSEAIKILAAAGANLESLDHSGQEPLNIAIGKGYKEAAQVLFNKIGGEPLPDEIFTSLYEIEKETLPISKVLEKKFTLVIDWLYNKNNPHFNNILNQLFVRYFSKKNTQDITTPEAVKMLDKALQLFPKDNRLLVIRVMQLASQKKYQETINKCKEVIQINPDALLPRFYLANHCINLGDYRAMEHYEKILPTSSSYEEAQDFLNQFRDFFKESNTLDAILARDNSDIIEKIDLSEKQPFLQRIFQPSLNPEELIHDLRNVSMAIKINNWWAAQFDLAKANDNKSLIVREEILNQIIETLKQENDAYYNLPLSNAYSNLGFIYLQLNLTEEVRFAKAKYVFEIAIALGTPRADVYFAYGDMVLKRNIKHAYRAFKKAVNLAPKDLYYQKKLNELIEVFKKMNQPLPDEKPQSQPANDKTTQSNIRADQKYGWLGRWVVALMALTTPIAGIYYIWRTESATAQEKRRELEQRFQEKVLKDLNALTQYFYQHQWQTLGESKFKLEGHSQLSIPSHLLKNQDLKTSLKDKAAFTIKNDVLKISMIGALQKIFGESSVDSTDNTYIVTVPSSYLSQDLVISNLIAEIINKLAEASPQFASVKRIKEEQEYLRQFDALIPTLKEHEKKLHALNEIRDLLLNHAQMLKTIEQYKTEAVGFNTLQNKDLKNLNKKVIDNAAQLIDEVKSFIKYNQSRILENIKLLVSRFYKQKWQDLGGNQFKLAHVPLISISTKALKNLDTFQKMQHLATFNVDADILKTAIFEVLQTICGEESVLLKSDEFILTLPTNYLAQNNFLINDRIEKIVGKLAINSKEFSDITQEKIAFGTDYNKESNVLLYYASILKEASVGIQKHEKSEEDKSIKIDLEKLKSDLDQADEYYESESLLKKMCAIYELKKLINKSIEERDAKATEIKEILDKEILDQAKNKPQAQPGQASKPAQGQPKQTSKPPEKSSNYRKDQEDKKKEKVKVEERAKESKKEEDEEEEKDKLVPILLSELPEQQVKLKTAAEPKAPAKPKVPLRPETKESEPSDIENQEDQESKKAEKEEEVEKEGKKEEGEEEKTILLSNIKAVDLVEKGFVKLSNRFFSKNQPVKEKSMVLNPYNAYVAADQRTKVAKHAMDVLNNILSHVNENQFNLDIAHMEKNKVVFVKVHYGIFYNIMRLMYALGTLGKNYNYIERLLFSGQAIKIRHNILKRSYMASDETFVKFDLVEKNDVIEKRKISGQLLISAKKIKESCESPIADLNKYGQFSAVEFWNMKNEFLLNSMSQTDRKAPVVKKFLEVSLRKLHQQLSVAELLCNENTLNIKFIVFAKSLVLAKLIRETAYSFPYIEKIDRDKLFSYINNLKNIKKINISDIKKFQNELSKWHQLIFSSDIINIQNMQLDISKDILADLQKIYDEKDKWEYKIRSMLDAKLINLEDKKVVNDYTEFCLAEMLFHSKNLELLYTEAAEVVTISYAKYFNDAILLSSMRMAAALVGQNLRNLPGNVRVDLAALIVKNIPDLMQGSEKNRFEYVRDRVGHQFFEKGDAVYVKEDRYFVFDEIEASYTLDLAKNAEKFAILLQNFLNAFQKARCKNTENAKEIQDEIKLETDEDISQLRIG